jgi:hypothetical protein
MRPRNWHEVLWDACVRIQWPAHAQEKAMAAARESLHSLGGEIN